MVFLKRKKMMNWLKELISLILTDLLKKADHKTKIKVTENEILSSNYCDSYASITGLVTTKDT